MFFEQKYSSTYNRWNTSAFTKNICEDLVNKNKDKKSKCSVQLKCPFSLKSLTKKTPNKQYFLESVRRVKEMFI